MPLTLAEVGEENIIKKIGGRQEVKTHLNNLVEVTVRGYELSICKADAEMIEIE